MHEVGIAQEVLSIVLEQAENQKVSRIHRITLRVGDQSGVVPEALEFAFEVVTRGTMAEEAELVLELSSADPAEGRSGRELDVVAIEVS
jgi:hydrogenase nickel incorporation protein HypA/HybF